MYGNDRDIVDIISPVLPRPSLVCIPRVIDLRHLEKT